jgi:hypothetical protein
MNEWVQIGLSKIKGAVEGQNNGLIARKDIPKDQVIAYYQDGADELNEAQFRARYPHGKPTHVWSNKAGVYYDGHTPNHIASAAMRGDPKINKNNARITGSGSVRTTKRIKAGEEIFLAYGGTFTILQAAANARTESSTLDVQPQPRRTAKTILQAAAATRENDVDYWALPNDERMYPNRYGYDPDAGFLYHRPPGPFRLQLSQAALAVKSQSQKRPVPSYFFENTSTPADGDLEKYADFASKTVTGAIPVLEKLHREQVAAEEREARAKKRRKQPMQTPTTNYPFIYNLHESDSD